jgi:hypothetical protein
VILALAASDRFIERIDKRHLSIAAIPGLAKHWCAQIAIPTNCLDEQSLVARTGTEPLRR